MSLFQRSPESDFRRHLGAFAERTVIRVVVSLRGDYDIGNQARLSRTLSRAITVGEADLVVDLSTVDFMDASTVSAILRCRESLQLQARSLTLRSPSTGARRLFELCDLAELIDPRPVDAAPTERTGNALSTWVQVPTADPSRRARWPRPRRSPVAVPATDRVGSPIGPRGVSPRTVLESAIGVGTAPEALPRSSESKPT